MCGSFMTSGLYGNVTNVYYLIIQKQVSRVSSFNKRRKIIKKSKVKLEIHISINKRGWWAKIEQYIIYECQTLNKIPR